MATININELLQKVNEIIKKTNSLSETQKITLSGVLARAADVTVTTLEDKLADDFLDKLPVLLASEAKSGINSTSGPVVAAFTQMLPKQKSLLSARSNSDADLHSVAISPVLDANTRLARTEVNSQGKKRKPRRRIVEILDPVGGLSKPPVFSAKAEKKKRISTVPVSAAPPSDSVVSTSLQQPQNLAPVPALPTTINTQTVAPIASGIPEAKAKEEQEEQEKKEKQRVLDENTKKFPSEDSRKEKINDIQNKFINLAERIAKDRSTLNLFIETLKKQKEKALSAIRVVNTEYGCPVDGAVEAANEKKAALETEYEKSKSAAENTFDECVYNLCETATKAKVFMSSLNALPISPANVRDLTAMLKSDGFYVPKKYRKATATLTYWDLASEYLKGNISPKDQIGSMLEQLRSESQDVVASSIKFLLSVVRWETLDVAQKTKVLHAYAYLPADKRSSSIPPTTIGQELSPETEWVKDYEVGDSKVKSELTLSLLNELKEISQASVTNDLKISRLTLYLNLMNKLPGCQCYLDNNQIANLLGLSKQHRVFQKTIRFMVTNANNNQLQGVLSSASAMSAVISQWYNDTKLSKQIWDDLSSTNVQQISGRALSSLESKKFVDLSKCWLPATFNMSSLLAIVDKLSDELKSKVALWILSSEVHCLATEKERLVGLLSSQELKLCEINCAFDPQSKDFIGARILAEKISLDNKRIADEKEAKNKAQNQLDALQKNIKDKITALKLFKEGQLNLYRDIFAYCPSNGSIETRIGYLESFEKKVAESILSPNISPEKATELQLEYLKELEYVDRAMKGSLLGSDDIAAVVKIEVKAYDFWAKLLTEDLQKIADPFQRSRHNIVDNEYTKAKQKIISMIKLYSDADKKEIDKLLKELKDMEQSPEFKKYTQAKHDVERAKYHVALGNDKGLEELREAKRLLVQARAALSVVAKPLDDKRSEVLSRINQIVLRYKKIMSTIESEVRKLPVERQKVHLSLLSTDKVRENYLENLRTTTREIAQKLKIKSAARSSDAQVQVSLGVLGNVAAPQDKENKENKESVVASVLPIIPPSFFDLKHAILNDINQIADKGTEVDARVLGSIADGDLKAIGFSKKSEDGEDLYDRFYDVLDRIRHSSVSEQQLLALQHISSALRSYLQAVTKQMENENKATKEKVEREAAEKKKKNWLDRKIVIAAKSIPIFDKIKQAHNLDTANKMLEELFANNTVSRQEFYDWLVEDKVIQKQYDEKNDNIIKEEVSSSYTARYIKDPKDTSFRVDSTQLLPTTLLKFMEKQIYPKTDEYEKALKSLRNYAILIKKQSQELIQNGKMKDEDISSDEKKAFLDLLTGNVADKVFTHKQITWELPVVLKTLESRIGAALRSSAVQPTLEESKISREKEQLLKIVDTVIADQKSGSNKIDSVEFINGWNISNIGTWVFNVLAPAVPHTEVQAKILRAFLNSGDRAKIAAAKIFVFEALKHYIQYEPVLADAIVKARTLVGQPLFDDILDQHKGWHLFGKTASRKAFNEIQARLAEAKTKEADAIQTLVRQVSTAVDSYVAKKDAANELALRQLLVQKNIKLAVQKMFVQQPQPKNFDFLVSYYTKFAAANLVVEENQKENVRQWIDWMQKHQGDIRDIGALYHWVITAMVVGGDDTKAQKVIAELSQQKSAEEKDLGRIHPDNWSFIATQVNDTYFKVVPSVTAETKTREETKAISAAKAKVSSYAFRRSVSVFDLYKQHEPEGSLKQAWLDSDDIDIAVQLAIPQFDREHRRISNSNFFIAPVIDFVGNNDAIALAALLVSQYKQQAQQNSPINIAFNMSDHSHWTNLLITLNPNNHEITYKFFDDYGLRGEDFYRGQLNALMSQININGYTFSQVNSQVIISHSQHNGYACGDHALVHLINAVDQANLGNCISQDYAQAVRGRGDSDGTAAAIRDLSLHGYLALNNMQGDTVAAKLQKYAAANLIQPAIVQPSQPAMASGGTAVEDQKTNIAIHSVSSQLHGSHQWILPRPSEDFLEKLQLANLTVLKADKAVFGQYPKTEKQLAADKYSLVKSFISKHISIDLRKLSENDAYKLFVKLFIEQTFTDVGLGNICKPFTEGFVYYFDDTGCSMDNARRQPYFNFLYELLSNVAVMDPTQPYTTKLQILRNSLTTLQIKDDYNFLFRDKLKSASKFTEEALNLIDKEINMNVKSPMRTGIGVDASHSAPSGEMLSNQIKS